jgi:NAD-specific glutamate dehydrogenase
LKVRTGRYDSDDAYLVVAADKGTASFSDLANGIAAEYGFWLGDAFASGGSQGYDHKKMGITARGAWESTRRLFRELGLDTQRQPFSVAGIGDMSGDVFGNGMLLSKQIRLLGAFNHQHIFVDPAPDPAASFAERQRLFRLERSAWTDFRQAIDCSRELMYGAAAQPDAAPDGYPMLESSVADLERLYFGFDIADIAQTAACDVAVAAAAWFCLNDYLDLFWLRRALDGLPAFDKWLCQVACPCDSRFPPAVIKRCCLA